MRSLRMAFLLITAVTIFSGCTAGRTVSNPFASTSNSVPSDGYSPYADTDYDSTDYDRTEYENDPPSEFSQPSVEGRGPVPPVPPARGISFTKQISLTQTVGRRRHIDNCTPDPACNAPAPSCRPAKSKCCENQSRGLFSWFRRKCNHCPKPFSCGAEQSWTAEPSCCVPESQCVPQYAQPLSCGGCATEDHCRTPRHKKPRCRPVAPQTCAQNSSRGLFGRLFGCLGKPCHAQGAYCRPGCTDSACAAPGCGAENYVINPGSALRDPSAAAENGHGQPPVAASQNGRSPLADPMEDPFAEPAVAPDHEANTRTPVPAAPNDVTPQQALPTSPPVGQPLRADDVPAAAQPAPALQPMPTPGDDQTWIEPSPWHRLGTPSSSSMTIQPRTHNAWSTSWPQK